MFDFETVKQCANAEVYRWTTPLFASSRGLGRLPGLQQVEAAHLQLLARGLETLKFGGNDART